MVLDTSLHARNENLLRWMVVIVIGICAMNITYILFCALELMWSMSCYTNDNLHAMLNCGLGLLD